MEIPERIPVVNALYNVLENPKTSPKLVSKIKSLIVSINKKEITKDNFLNECIKKHGFVSDEIFNSLYCVDQFVPALAEYAIYHEKYSYLILLINNRFKDGLPTKSSYIAEEYLKTGKTLDKFLEIFEDKLKIEGLILDIALSTGVEANQIVYNAMLTAREEHCHIIIRGYLHSGNLDYYFDTLKSFGLHFKIMDLISGSISSILCDKVADFVDIYMDRYMGTNAENDSALKEFVGMLVDNKDIPENVITYLLITIMHRVSYLKTEEKIKEAPYLKDLLGWLSPIIVHIINSNYKFKHFFTNEKRADELTKIYPKNHNFHDELMNYFSERGLLFQNFMICDI